MTEYFLPTTGKLHAQITQYEMLKDQKYRMPQKSYDICCVVQSRRYGRAQGPWEERGRRGAGWAPARPAGPGLTHRTGTECERTEKYLLKIYTYLPQKYY